MDMNERRLSAVKSKPVLAFVGNGTLPEYIGRVYAAIADTHATILRVSGDTTPSNALLMIAPGDKHGAPDAKHLEEQRKAIQMCSSCCLLLKAVRQIPESGYLTPATRGKVQLIVFHGDPIERQALERVVRLLFRHLHPIRQVIFESKASDAIEIAGEIVRLAA